MAIEPYLIGASLNMILAQRLVRRICSKCKQPYDPPRNVRKALERMGCDVSTFFRGVGCRSCRNTGFRGRIGVHEILVLDDQLRDLVISNPNITAIRQTAQRGGMVTLRQDGFRKVREGITTIEEIFHISGDVRASDGPAAGKLVSV